MARAFYPEPSCWIQVDGGKIRLHILVKHAKFEKNVAGIIGSQLFMASTSSNALPKQGSEGEFNEWLGVTNVIAAAA